jgi:hypothetical protein
MSLYNVNSDCWFKLQIKKYIRRNNGIQEGKYVSFVITKSH